jgi:hypothetical protein
MGRNAKRGALNSALELLGMFLIGAALLIILFYIFKDKLSPLFVNNYK